MMCLDLVRNFSYYIWNCTRCRLYVHQNVSLNVNRHFPYVLLCRLDFKFTVCTLNVFQEEFCADQALLVRCGLIFSLSVRLSLSRDIAHRSLDVFSNGLVVTSQQVMFTLEHDSLFLHRGIICGWVSWRL